MNEPVEPIVTEETPERKHPVAAPVEEPSETIPTEITWMDFTTGEKLPGPPAAVKSPQPQAPEPEKTPELPPGVKPLGPVQPESGITWSDIERGTYWRRVLTGDPDTVPDDIRRAAGADDAAGTPEDREYRLLSTVNRSWAVDHLGLSREQVRADWGSVRRDMANQLGVANNEREVFTALSLREQEAPMRKEAARVYEQAYLQALTGEDDDSPASAEADAAGSQHPRWEELRMLARERAEQDSEECQPHLDALMRIMDVFEAAEGNSLRRLRMLWNAPELLDDLDELAALDDSKRAVLYRMLPVEMKRLGKELRPINLPEAMIRSWRRGTFNLGYSVVQALGNVITTHLDQYESPTVRAFAEKQDKRLRVIEELRQVAHRQYLPLYPGEDSPFIEQLLVDMSGAVPGVAMAFCGPVGVSVLAASSAGSSIAGARQRAPEGDRRLQVAAGCLAGAVQGGIYAGMTALGRRMFERVIRSFAASAGQGVKGYLSSMAKSAYWFTQENINLLMAGKASQVAEMGLQEMAALASDTASRIDWQGFGDNLLDLELNIREAAMNLPFILIAGGRVALHHFRRPATILGDGRMLDEWGVAPAAKKRIMEAADTRYQGMLLQMGLRESSRWGGISPEFLSSFFTRCLRLLHIDELKIFDNDHVVRSFLNLPPLSARVTALQESQRPPLPLPPPEKQAELHPHFNRQSPVNEKKYLFLTSLMYEWYRKGGFDSDPMPPGSVRLYPTGKSIPLMQVHELPRELQQNGFYAPGAERVRRAMLADTCKLLEQNSYRFLLNCHTLDRLLNLPNTTKVIALQMEKSRRRIYQLVAHEVLQAVLSRGFNGLRRRITDYFQTYYMGQKTRLFREPWVMKVPARVFSELDLPIYTSYGHLKVYPFELAEHVRISRQLESVVKRLYGLLPHMEEFQSLIAQGYSTRQGYEELLKRELGADVLDASFSRKKGTWIPLKKAVDENERSEYIAHNRAQFELFRQLLGRDLEKDITLDGKEVWRIGKADGSVSRWHDSPTAAINDLAHFYRMRSVMPYGRNAYMPFVLKHGMLNGLQFMKQFQIVNRTYSGNEALSIRALDDMLKLWMSNASVCPLGLNLGRNEYPFKVPSLYDGVEGIMFRKIGSDANHYLFDCYRNATPLNLIVARARVYWRRMLHSGWADAKEVIQFLLDHDAIKPYLAERLLIRTRPFRNFRRKSTLAKIPKIRAARFRRFRTLNPYITDYVTAVEGVSEKMARLSGLLLLADMERLNLPTTLREWVAASAYREESGNAHRPEQLSKDTHEQKASKRGSVAMVRWFNDKNADYLKSHAGTIAKLREQLRDADSALSKSPLYHLTREMWEPAESQRKEQCWSYLLCGDSAFLNLDQRYWNMLQHPVKAWQLLDAELQETMRVQFEELCRQHPAPGEDGKPTEDFEACLRNLQQQLERYPQLRDYSIDRKHPDSLLKLELEPAPAADREDPLNTILTERSALPSIPEMLPGGRMQPANLPEPLTDAPGVMPALHLLTALRYYATSMPQVREDGIWWNDRRYGGVDGHKPAGLDGSWAPEKPLEGLFSMLARVQEQGGGEPLSIAGIDIAPLPDISEHDQLRHITVYRPKSYPAVQVRLMPGSEDSQMMRRRAPYVVHSLGGVPLPERINWIPGADDRLLYHNLMLYHRKTKRITYIENVHHGPEFLEYVFSELLERCQSPEQLQAGRQMDMSNLELVMHLAQDTNFSESLRDVQPGEMVFGEALMVRILRDMLNYEFGGNQEQAAAELMELGKLMEKNPEWIPMLRDMLREKCVNHVEIISRNNAVRRRAFREAPEEEFPELQSMEDLRLRYERSGRKRRPTDDEKARQYMKHPVQHIKPRTYDGFR